ncbi:AMP-binding protein [Dasania marina]|uniref:AMP-binding protein n=1 Tax=Dasania marina TaxID=471499 RepID=UPI0030D9B73D|tara:strand:- start:5087 stop:6643 length:1557 start_codon:yes stop_codon:yes gene_type:complete
MINNKTTIPAGNKGSVTHSAIDMLALQARTQPDRLAAMDLSYGQQWSYSAFDKSVAQCASVLLQHGINVGDRVASLAKNRVELIMLHLACSRTGSIYVPLNWRLSPTEIAGLIEDAEPKLLFGDDYLQTIDLNRINQQQTVIESITLDQLAEEISAATPLPPAPINAELPSLILYTSGTSGKPKGVLLSENNITETAINFSLLGKVNHHSVVLCDTPMFHVIGLVTNIRPFLMHGGSLIVSDGFVPATTLARLADSQLAISHYFCVPQMAEALRAEPSFNPAQLRGLTALFTGGAPHPAASINAWLNDGIAIVDGYGMSEVGTVFGMPLNRKLIAERAGSVGIATTRVQARIVDVNGNDCAIGTAGELLLKGANVTKGYWRREQETLAAFTDDGWLRTGDIARCDEQGYHWLVDRRKDMFISGGENVYPAEIEAVLAGHPQVKESAVVARADQRWGEVGHLYLVAQPGCELDTDSIIAYLEQKIARYKVPKYLSLIDALPRNGAGKVLKNTLRELTDN